MRSKTNLLYMMIVAVFLGSFCYDSSKSDSLPDFKDLLNNYENNFKSAMTFRAEVKSTKKSIYDIGTVEYWTKESIWYDRGSLCCKITDGDYFNNSPKGLVLEEDDRGGRYFTGIIVVNSMSIFTEESQAWYDGSKFATVNYFENTTVAINSNYLLRYQSVFGKSLKEMLLKCYEEGKVTVQSENLDGEACVKLQWEFPNQGGGTVWLVPSKGHCIKKLQTQFKGEILNEYSKLLRSISRVFGGLRM